MEIITALIAGTILACIIGFTQSYIVKLIESNKSIELESEVLETKIKDLIKNTEKKIAEDKSKRYKTFVYYVTPEDLEKFEESMIVQGNTYKEVKWFEITIKKDK